MAAPIQTPMQSIRSPFRRRPRGSGGGGVPSTSALLMEDGASFLLLENGTDRIMMEA